MEALIPIFKHTSRINLNKAKGFISWELQPLVMTEQFDQVMVLEQCQIFPPLNSVPTTSFPLTFFDVSWFYCCPIQRVFLYQVTFSSAQFIEEVLPQLKKSLSLALQRFFPFCGNLACPPPPNEPHILYNEGDSVPLLVAQSTGAFADFLRDEPKDARDIHKLMPPTPPSFILDDKLTELTPLLAVQVTLFPNSGLCIGIKFRHIVADGSSFNHFVKTWASIFNANCDISSVSMNMPVIDKSVIKDPDGIRNVFMDQWRARRPGTRKDTTTNTKDLLRATFPLSRNGIEHLKDWVTSKLLNETDMMPRLQLSTFVVTTSFIWVCLIKSLDLTTADDAFQSPDERCHLGIAVDCRNKYGLGIPETFFGNCIIGKLISVARNKFRDEDCVAILAEAISQCVQSLKCGVLKGHKHTLSKWREVATSGEVLLTVAGSPKLAAYETDFGWGQPAKTEVVHIDATRAISLSESKNEKGGIEVGICLTRHQMSIFTSLFQAGMNQFL